MRYLLIIVGVVGLLTGTVAAQDEEYYFQFPLDTPSEAMIQEVHDCVLSQAETEDVTWSEANLEALPEPETACDWAQLGYRYAQLADEEINTVSEVVLDAYIQAVTMNPAFATRDELLIVFWSEIEHLVAPPDFGERTLEEVHIEYVFAGGATHFDITLTPQNDAEYQVKGTVGGMDDFGEEITDTVVAGVVNAEKVAALPLALTNLIPINSQFTDQPCWHVLPDWVVTLVFDDGSEIQVVNNESNVLSAGGPWQTTIDDQHYMQLGPAFLIAVLDIRDELELPYGFVMSYGCARYENTVNLAFPLED